MAPITSDSVWRALGAHTFAVLSWVTPQRQARSAGIVYLVRNRKLIIGAEQSSWKVRHIRANPQVSITVLSRRRIALLPWIRLPDATITFHGEARVIAPADVDQQVLHELEKGMKPDPERNAHTSFIEITPRGEFLSYGIGVSAMKMGDPSKARGRVAVD